jgi:predicted DCC family thiol-disulfide oxidoreductase YuxK
VPVTLIDRLFEPANARILGVARAGIGIAALMELAASMPRLMELASPDALRLPIVPAIGAAFYQATPVVLLAWLAAGIGFSLGWRTSISGWLLGLVFFGLVLSDQQLYSNHSYLIGLAVVLLTVGGSGRSWSLDARRLGTDADAAPAWTILALRAQLTILYAFAVLAKLNPSFLSGSVVAASLRRGGLAFPETWITFEWMFLLSILVIVGEAFLAVGLWRRRWRPAAFVVGLVLHVGILVVMQNAWDLAVFTAATLSLYIAFVDAPRGRLAVVWDDGCGFCGAWVRWFGRLDWLDVHRFVPRSRLAESGLPVSADAAVEALHLVEPSGTSRAFAAVRRILARLPVSFLWAPLLAIRPIPSVGERVYARVAARRTCPVTISATLAPVSASRRSGT